MLPRHTVEPKIHAGAGLDSQCQCPSSGRIYFFWVQPVDALQTIPGLLVSRADA